MTTDRTSSAQHAHSAQQDEIPVDGPFAHDDAATDTSLVLVNDPLNSALVDVMLSTPWRTRWGFASDPDSPLDALEWFARFDPEPLVAVAAIMNPSLQPEALELAASFVDEKFRLEALANSVNQTPQGLITLSRSGFVDVRRAVLLNPGCPVSVATRLAVRDGDDGVRRAAVFHRDLPAATMREAMRDTQPCVRMAVCERTPPAPHWLVEELACDRDALVRAAAQRALGLTDDV